MRERTNLAVWAIAAFLFCAHVPTAVAWDDWENDESSLVDEHDESEAPNHDDDAPEDDSSRTRRRGSRPSESGNIESMAVASTWSAFWRKRRRSRATQVPSGRA